MGVHQDAFTVNGFSTWVKAQKTLQTHNMSAVHKYAMAAWAEFKTRRVAGSRICNALDEGHSQAVRENRVYMKAVVEALRYTACQGIALRGHREGDESSNRGNFLEFLHSISKFNQTVAEKIATCAQNAKYTHHSIQDEVIALMANMLRDKISSDVRDAGMFALLVDESKDVSKKEQVSVVVRYLQGDGVREDFLHFTPAEGLDAESLLALIKNTLSKCNINHQQCIAQCYDGAAVMSGGNSGVQERFRREVPQALYVHCHAHRLNLVLTDCVGRIQAAGDFFEGVQILHNFFSSSIVHNLFLQKQKELEPNQQPLELKSLSETRWACQYSALLAIKKTLPAIHATLQALIRQQGARLRTKAKSIMALLDGQFVLQLTLFEDVFRTTKFLSDTLQSPNLDYSSALDLVESVTASLSEKRNETSLKDISDKAQALCAKTGISTQLREEPRSRQPPGHLQEFIIDTQTGQRQPLASLVDIRRHCYYNVLDELINELRRRFSAETCGVLQGTCALNPKHKAFLSMEMLWPMAQHYGVTHDNLTAELHQIQRLLITKGQQGHSVGTTHEFLALLQPYKDSFCDIHKLLCISLTVPVTSAACERSFSCLARVKNYLRNRSGDSRNSDLGLLAISAARARSLDADAIVDTFAVNHNNRRIVLL